MMVVCFHHLPGRGKPIKPNEKQTRGPAERVSSTYLDISYMICFSTGCFTRTNSSGNRTSPLYSTCQHKHAKPVMVCLRNQPRFCSRPPPSAHRLKIVPIAKTGKKQWQHIVRCSWRSWLPVRTHAGCRSRSTPSRQYSGCCPQQNCDAFSLLKHLQYPAVMPVVA